MLDTYLPRALETRLDHWRTQVRPKPLVLRGPRQVGKSTLVRAHGRNYNHYLELNLERERDRNLFDQLPEVGAFLQGLYFRQGIRPAAGESVLLFIDEIQQAPRAIQFLRYLYEDQDAVHVIAAGSLLEFAFGDVKSMPVGRVEFVPVFPLTFREYLVWRGREVLAEALREVPAPTPAHPYLAEAFRDYSLTGGMPAVVRALAGGAELAEVQPLYESIWDAYAVDLERHARTDLQRDVMRFVIREAPTVHDRFNYANFAGSTFRSREVRAALEALEMARVLQLVRPTSSVALPVQVNLRARPRLQFLDVGLLNYATGLQRSTLAIDDLASVYRGRLALQVVTQELIAFEQRYSYEPHFWIRENRNTNAEVDLVHQYGMDLLGLEVKSGAQGRLRSLHEFVERSGSGIGLRVLANAFSVEEASTASGYGYKLVNLPYYAVGQLDAYIQVAVERRD